MVDNNSNITVLDMLAITSLALQMQNYQTSLHSVTNDDLMHELQRQNKAYLETIIENQNKIMKKLAELG